MSGLAVDGRAFTSPAGGVRRYVTELYRALAPMVEGGVTAIGATVDACPPGVRPLAAGWSAPSTIGWLSTGLPAAARRLHPAVLHAPAYGAPIAPGVPVVLTLHDVSYARRPEWYPGQLDPVRRWFYRRSALSAAAILTDSAFSRDEILAAYPVSADRVHVVPLAAGDAFHANSAQPRDTHTVLHVGDLHPRRNLTMLLDVIVALRQHEPALAGLRLRLVGVDRGCIDDLRHQAAAAGHTDALHWDGPISEAALVSAYQSASVLAYPSRYEGFGLPVLEAMACGLPVVASDAASIPEVAGEAGLLVPPTDARAWADALRAVLGSPARAEAMSGAGRQRASRFSWTRTASESLAVFRTVGRW